MKFAANAKAAIINQNTGRFEAADGDDMSRLRVPGFFTYAGFHEALLGRMGRVGDTAFVCGPELMMLSAARALEAQHLPGDQVYVSLERNMHCGVAHCGRCQLGPVLLCRDGAVTTWGRVGGMMAVHQR